MATMKKQLPSDRIRQLIRDHFNDMPKGYGDIQVRAELKSLRQIVEAIVIYLDEEIGGSH